MPGGPSILNQLASQLTVAEHQFNTQVDYLVQWRALRSKISRYSRFALCSRGHEYFSELGIATEPDAAGAHSHPVSKTLEDYRLRVVLIPLLNRTNFTCYFTKPSKHTRLVSDAGKDERDCPLINHLLVEQDPQRYPTSVELPLKPCDTEVAYMSDTIHYLTPRDIVRFFRESPNMNRLVASAIIPVPLLMGIKEFSTPAYSYRTSGSSFEHAPDGNWSESYTQPKACRWLLECSSIHDLGIDLGVHVSWSADPEHMIIITRGISQLNSSISLEVVGRSMMDGPGGPILVPTRAVEFVANYCHAPGSASKRTIWARLNAWCHDKSSCKITTHERKVIADAAYADRMSEEGGWYPSSFAPPHWVTDPIRNALWNAMVGAVKPFMASHHGVSNYFRPAVWSSPRRAKYLQGKDKHSAVYSHSRITAARDLPAALASVIDRTNCSREDVRFSPVLGGNGRSTEMNTLRERVAVLLLLLPFLVSFAVPLYLDDYHFLLRAWRVVSSSRMVSEPLWWYTRHGTFIHFINLLIGYCPALVTGPLFGVVLPLTRVIWRWYIFKMGSLVRSVWVSFCRRYPTLWDVDLAIHMLFFPHFIHVEVTGQEVKEDETGVEHNTAEGEGTECRRDRERRDPNGPRTPQNTTGPDLSYVTNSENPPKGWNSFMIPSCHHNTIHFLPADGDEPDYLFGTIAGAGRELLLHPPATRLWEFDVPHKGMPDACGILSAPDGYYAGEPCASFPEFIRRISTEVNITHRVVESEVPEDWTPGLSFEPMVVSFGGFLYGVNLLADPIILKTNYKKATVEDHDEEEGLQKEEDSLRPKGPILEACGVQDIMGQMGIRPGRSVVRLPNPETRTPAQDRVCVEPQPIQSRTRLMLEEDSIKPSVRLPRLRWSEVMDDPCEMGAIEPVNTHPDLNETPDVPATSREHSPMEKIRDMELVFLGGKEETITPERDNGVCLLDALEDATGENRVKLWAQLSAAAPHPAHTYLGVAPPPLDTNTLRRLSSTRRERYLVHYNGNTHEYSAESASMNWKIVELFNIGNKHWTGRPEQPWSEHRSVAQFASPRPSGPRVPLPSTLEGRWFKWCRSYSTTYRWSKPRAKAAVKAFQGKGFGTFIPNVQGLLPKWDSLLSSPPSSTRRPIRVSGLMGEGGTGKSYGFLEILRTMVEREPHNEDWCVIAPTDVLRSEITSHLGLPDGMGYKVKTWEVALVQRLPRTIYIDDCGLVPPILDLLLLLNPSVVNIFFSGDLGQNVWEFGPEVPGWKLAKPTVELLAPSSCDYLRVNRRIAQGTGSQLGVQVEGNREGRIRFGSNRKAAIITSTTGAANTFRSLGREAYTTNTCQGLSVRSSEILVDHYLEKSSDRALNTALYRSRGEVWINLPYKAATRLRPSSNILRGLLDASEGDWDRLSVAMREHRIRYTPRQLTDPTKLPGRAPPPLEELLFPPPLSGNGWNDRIAREVNAMAQRVKIPYRNTDEGKEEVREWEPGKTRRSWTARAIYFAALPWLWLAYNLGFTDPFDNPSVANLKPPLDMPYEQLGPSIGYNTYEVCTLPGAAADVVDMLFKTRVFGREVYYKGWLTEQVDDTDSCTSMFLRHRRCDKATEAWTFKERHVPPKPPAPHYLGGGSALFEAFNHVYEPEYPSFSEQVWEECHDEDLDNLLDKGPKALKNISYRSDTSLEPGKAEIFLKGQQITKPGTAFREAKKGQMITGFQTLINARFGAMSRYVTKAMRKALPKNIMLLTGLSLDDQEGWFQKWWNWKKHCYEDDFVAFDGTQNEDFLAFQVMVMRALDLPTAVIEDYVNWVTHLHGMLGPMGVFIASGFKPTWIFNTLDNMAFQAVKHDLKPGRTVARAFSGDDSVHNERVIERAGYRDMKHSYRLKSKGVHTKYPTFCGTTNLPIGSFADPTLLLQRVLFRLRRGDLFASALSYAEHCSKLTAVLPMSMDYLNGKQLEHHTLTRRILRYHLEASGRSLIGTFFTKLNAGRYDLSY